MRKTLFMGIGVPGSGKSTKLKEIARNYNYRYISADEQRLLINGSVESQANSKQVWWSVFRLFDEACSATEVEAIVVDNTNITFENRKKFYTIAERYLKYDWDIVLVYVNVPLELALERNSKRDRVVPEHVIRRMYENLEAPTEWERNQLGCRVIEVNK